MEAAEADESFVELVQVWHVTGREIECSGAVTEGAVALVRVSGVHALRDVVLDHLLAVKSVRSTQTVFVLDEWRADPVAAVLDGT